MASSATDIAFSAEAGAQRALQKLRGQLFEKSIDASRVRFAFADADISGEQPSGGTRGRARLPLGAGM